MSTGKDDCCLLVTALIPPGRLGEAHRAMAEAAPDGTLFACEYVDPAGLADRDEILLMFETCGRAMARSLAAPSGEG